MTDDMKEEGFARRWARLKREALEAPAEAPPPVIAEEPPLEVPPPADTIPLEDIAAWMGKRLPDGWREAALRRVWSADVSIRDFVGLADYAWDWNTPGGAPGWGPMRAIDDMVQLVARAIGEDLPPPEPALATAEDLPVVAVESEAQADAPFMIDVETLEIETERTSPPLPRRGGRATPI